jgi:hypothetical protein
MINFFSNRKLQIIIPRRRIQFDKMVNGEITVDPKKYPVEYKQWLELTMHENEWGESWYSVDTLGPPMKEWKKNLKYASTKVGRHRLKRIWRGSVH